MIVKYYIVTVLGHSMLSKV